MGIGSDGKTFIIVIAIFAFLLINVIWGIAVIQNVNQDRWIEQDRLEREVEAPLILEAIRELLGP